MLKFFVLFSMAFMLTACQNAYQKYYQDYSRGNRQDFVVSSEVPKVIQMDSDENVIVTRMFEDGFALVGASSFRGPRINTGKAIKQARLVGASRIVIAPKTIYDTAPPKQSARVSASKADFSTYYPAYGSDSGTTSTQAPTPPSTPSSPGYPGQIAYFFAPLKPSCIGMLYKELTGDEARLVGNNHGIRVYAVRRDSPAYTADFMPGDLITEINGYLPDQAPEPVSGEIIDYKILRDSRRLSRTLRAGDCS